MSLSKYFLPYMKKMLLKGMNKIERKPEGPNPKPDFRKVGKSPEDTSGYSEGFKGDKKPTF